MPVAAAFLYKKPFSPDAHCPADKTTAQLDAISTSRYEDASLTNIMALWWNLYTLGVTVTFSGGTAQSKTTFAVKIGKSEGIVDLQAEPDATPSNRVCAPKGSAHLGDGIATGVSTSSTFSRGGNDTYFEIWFREVYFNTTTGKYALLFELNLGQGAAGTYCDTPGYSILDSNISSPIANGGTVSFLGQNIVTKRSSGGGFVDVSITIASPSYYTY